MGIEQSNASYHNILTSYKGKRSATSMRLCCTHRLCRWTNEERVSEARSRRIRAITHSLCGWSIEERVSESSSWRIEAITHSLYGWTNEERVSETSSQRIEA